VYVDLYDCRQMQISPGHWSFNLEVQHLNIISVKWQVFLGNFIRIYEKIIIYQLPIDHILQQ